MAVTAPQTSYGLSQTQALPGMLASMDPGQLVEGAFKAGETGILPGLMVEIDPSDPTKCRLPQTASAAGVMLGVVIYNPLDPPSATGYSVGQQVRVLRRGRIYAQFNGTTGSDMGTDLKVNSSSTVATNRGKLTDAATSAGAGTEIYQTKMKVFQETGTVSGLVLVELNGALQ